MSSYEADLFVCGILYFKLNGLDAINEITKPRINYLVKGHHLYSET
jgi:hypothetical protein